MGDLVIPKRGELIAIEDAGKVLKELVPAEEMFDGEQIAFPVIEIMHAGNLFKFPDETTAPTFEGVVLFTQKMNVYWQDPPGSEGDRLPPDCASDDGITPNSSITQPMAKVCKGCPYNQFGSRKDGGDGKACRNLRRLLIVREGHPIPYRMALSPSSLGAWNKYLTHLASLGIRHQAIVLTEFGLERKTRGSQQWSVCTLKPVAGLPLETARQMRDLSKSMGAHLAEAPISTEEYSEGENNEDDGVPF